MSEIGEGIGTATEGGLLARASEKSDGEGGETAYSGPCLNCGAELTGPHCRRCGQKAQVHRSIAAIMHDIMHGVLHLDGKLWRTLPLLAWKPGELTRRYIDGERAKFVSPMAMFLFSVFLMFAIFQVIGFSTPTDLPDLDESREAVEELRTQAEQEREAWQAQAAALPENSPERVELESRIAESGEALGALDEVQAYDLGDDSKLTISATGIEAIDNVLLDKWRSQPELMLYKLQNNAYKFSWLLIPISIPIVWSLFFWKRRFKAYDHAIFVTYSLAFVSLLYLLLSVLGKIGLPALPLIIAGFLIPPVHIYRQLRGAYQLTHPQTLWRTFALVNAIVFGVTTLFLWILLLLGAL